MPTQNTPEVPRLLECPAGTEYDEQAFQYFVSLEAARAARAGQHVRLLLAAIEPTTNLPMPFSRVVARSVFEGLRSAMRETDIIGWHRQGLVAGVVLTAWPETLAGGLSVFERRIEHGLRRRLPVGLARSLRVRVVTHGPANDRSGM